MSGCVSQPEIAAQARECSVGMAGNKTDPKGTEGRLCFGMLVGQGPFTSMGMMLSIPWNGGGKRSFGSGVSPHQIDGDNCH